MELQLRGQRDPEEVKKPSESTPAVLRGGRRRGSANSISDRSHLSRSYSGSSNSELSLGSDVSRRTASSEPQGTHRRKSAVQAIKNMVARSEHLILSKTETIISKTFVLDRHIKAIGHISKVFNCAVSIRESGASTLRCLALGAAAKGHHILEKTIKESSIYDAYGDRAEEIMARVKAAQIDGYVGRWDDDRGLIGIFVGPEAKKHPGLARHLITVEGGKTAGGETAPDQDYYPIDIGNLESSLQPLKSTVGWQSIPFTGDYDLHDLLSFDSPRTPITQGTETELMVQTSINAGISAVDDELRPIDRKHKEVVQHGSQYNFVAHMAAEERVYVLPSAVAMPSFPLAMCERGNWSIIKNLDALNSFYQTRGFTLKESWKDSNTYFVNQPDGRVISRRSSVQSLETLDSIDLGSGEANRDYESNVEGEKSSKDSEQQAKGGKSV